MGKFNVSVRELQQNLERVIARVEHGETAEVTRRRPSGPGQGDATALRLA